MSFNFTPPINDIQTREVYLKGNLRVRRGDKLYIFGDTREIHLLNGFYYQDNFVGMSVWPDLRISQQCLIQEENVRAVETADNSLYTRTVEGFFLKRTNVTNNIRDEIIRDILNEQKYDEDEEEEDEIVITEVHHGTVKFLNNFNNE